MGQGLGAGQGAGARPEEEDATSTFQARVRQQVGKGGARITGEVYGPNRKGNVQEEIKQALQTFESQDADPLTNQRLPRTHQDHAREYFEALRDGR